MTASHPDVAGAVLALDQAMIALAVAKSTLLGETSGPMTVPLAGKTFAHLAGVPGPGDPYDAGKHGHYDAASAAEAAGVPGLVGHRVEDAHDDSPTPATGTVICQLDDEHLSVRWDGEDDDMREPFESLRPARTSFDHLPQHTGGHPECTAPGCGQPGHHLHAATIPADGA